MTNIMVAALEDTIQLRGQEVNKMQSDYLCKYVFNMFSYIALTSCGVLLCAVATSQRVL